MARQGSSVTPFSIRLLATDDRTDIDLLSLLPASYRTSSDNLVAPKNQVMNCIGKELDLERLDKVQKWLWVAGRPLPPRPLHCQLFLGREIIAIEQMGLHLVWTTGRMFLKPVPRFLLEPRFWTEYLSCLQGCECAIANVQCGRKKLRRCALGFLFSYAALITHENDLLIAKEKRLIPSEVKWQDWRKFVEELDTENIYSRINIRFIYGELRLGRLNKIYYSQRPFLCGYVSRWNQYKSFFHDNFTWLASTTVYIVVVLTALQVGLATNSLGNNAAFQSASYGFTILSILGPLIASGIILVLFIHIFLSNWHQTVKYRNQRLHSIGISSGGA
ncbi:hypothetical protein F5Y08DRAFT_308401 [Xylaria arbuscula]|nr:hypothetical protein F5Y08DRAFT_308401 [Xylaria arbuscula]